jgi:TetR/AcrR family transcriptional repressor of nem operon
MRVSREKAAENRRRIVETAGRLFRDKGFDGVGVDAIMKCAGLTHGGFYGHFASKEALAEEASAAALRSNAALQAGAASLSALVDEYLSERHRADRANGCAVAALAGDVGRQGQALRKTFTASVRAQVDRITAFLKRGSPAARRRRALATYAGIVGALTLARAVDDPAFAQEILAAARESFGEEY